MRILIILPDNPLKKILVELSERQHIRKVKDLINRKKNSEAIDFIQNGRLGRELGTDEFENLGTDLILSNDSAHWDNKREK